MRRLRLQLTVDDDVLCLAHARYLLALHHDHVQLLIGKTASLTHTLTHQTAARTHGGA
jgi:hypothetical protein